MENTQNNTLEFQIGVTANTNEDNSNDIVKNNTMDIMDSSNSEDFFKIAIEIPDVAVEMLMEHLENKSIYYTRCRVCFYSTKW